MPTYRFKPEGPHFDNDGHFIHPCCVCGGHAYPGFGVRACSKTSLGMVLREVSRRANQRTAIA
jgi:hypothetical protein